MINELTRKNAHTELDHIFKTILPAHGMTERPEQIRLSHTMLDAMFENRIALSDAGTGIGKTYAYLTAAIVYSHSRLVDGLPFQPVIIATSSIALQNAIVREYLPFLSDALSDDPHITTPILAALRKGKSHYVCDERLRQHLQQRPNGKNVMQKKELYSLRDVLDLDETQKLSSFDRERVCVPQFCDCKHPDCRYRRHLTECGQKRYLFQICNQNLWLADCMHRDNGLKPILPDACTVIVDEAHKLPETAREMFGTTLTAGEIRGAVVRLKQDGYALAADRLFSASSMLLQKMAELSPEYPVELLHDDLSRVLSTLFLIGRKLSTFLEPATKRALEQLTDKVVLFLRPKPDTIRYTAEDDDGKLMLCSVPADITSRMQRTVWSKQIPLLLTSGTLAIGSSFHRFQDECGLSSNPRVTEAVAVRCWRTFLPAHLTPSSQIRRMRPVAARRRKNPKPPQRSIPAWAATRRPTLTATPRISGRGPAGRQSGCILQDVQPSPARRSVCSLTGGSFPAPAMRSSGQAGSGAGLPCGTRETPARRRGVSGSRQNTLFGARMVICRSAALCRVCRVYSNTAIRRTAST